MEETAGLQAGRGCRELCANTGTWAAQKGTDHRASYAIVTGRSVAFDRWVGRLEAIKTEGASPWFVRQEPALRFTPVDAIFLSVDRPHHQKSFCIAGK